jgi:MFS superfamily sulfate permease-like transporter
VPNSGTCALSIISKKTAMAGLTSNFRGTFMYVAIATSCYLISKYGTHELFSSSVMAATLTA